MNIKFIYDIIDADIRIANEQRDKLRSDELEDYAYFSGAIEALEHTKENLRQFVISANKLTKNS
jgi:hypothetical protein